MRRDDERLADIIEATEKISVRVGKGRQAFDADEDVQIVLVHLVQVIGEAASGLSDELTSEHPEVPWRQIVAIRNRHDQLGRRTAHARSGLLTWQLVCPGLLVADRWSPWLMAR